MSKRLVRCPCPDVKINVKIWLNPFHSLCPLHGDLQRSKNNGCRSKRWNFYPWHTEVEQSEWKQRIGEENFTNAILQLMFDHVVHSARSKCSKPRGETTREGQLKRKLAGETKVETYKPQNQVRGPSTKTVTPWPPHALSSPRASCSWALAAELPTAEKNCWLQGKKEKILFQQPISLVNPASSQDKIEVRSSSLHGLHMAWEPGGFSQLTSCWKRIPPLTSYSWECHSFFSSLDRVSKSFAWGTLPSVWNCFPSRYF